MTSLRIIYIFALFVFSSAFSTQADVTADPSLQNERAMNHEMNQQEENYSAQRKASQQNETPQHDWVPEQVPQDSQKIRKQSNIDTRQDWVSEEVPANSQKPPGIWDKIWDEYLSKLLM